MYSKKQLSQTNDAYLNRWAPLLFVCLMALSWAGCVEKTGNESESSSVGVGTSRQALTAVQSRVLGFEAPTTDWSTPNGGAHITQSTTASEGTNALAVVPADWTEINSVPLSSLGRIGQSVSIDLRLPQTVTWGEVRLILKTPSRGIWWGELGSQSLIGLSAGTYHRVSFSIPPNIEASLEGSYSDLTITVAVNAPVLASPYLIDRLQFGGGNGGGDGGSDSDSDSDGDGDGDSDSDAEPESFSITLPQGLGLHDVALGTSESMRVSNYVHVIAPSGGVAALANTGIGEVGLETDAVIDGSIISVGPVRLSNRTVVHGDVIAGGDIIPQNPYTVDGVEEPHATVELGRAYSWEVAFPEGGENQSLEPGQSRDLDPGYYGDVSVKPNAILRLRAGTYYLGSLMADSGSRIEIAGNGEPVFLYVKNSFTSRAIIAHSQSSSDFLVGYLGTGMVELGEPFAGTIVAPNGTIRLAPLNGGSHEGSFFAKQINAEADTPVNFVPFGHWDFVFPPVLTLECVSRAAKEHAAGLFSYENILDIPVTIPEGPRNYVDTSEALQGPLHYFEPGYHEKYYWLPYVGAHLSWTLDGKTAGVDENTRGCRTSDYTIRPVPPESPMPDGPMDDQFIPFSGTALDPDEGELVVAGEGEGICGHDGARFDDDRGVRMQCHTKIDKWQWLDIPVDHGDFTPPVTESTIRLLTLSVTGLYAGDDFGGGDLKVDGKVSFDGITQEKRLLKEDSITDQKPWPIGQHIDYQATVADNDWVNVTIDVIERDDWINPDDHEIWVDMFVNSTTGEIDEESLLLSGEDDDNAWIALAQTNDDGKLIGLLVETEDDWTISFKMDIAVHDKPKPKLCAYWYTQYRDSDFKEDDAASKLPQWIPASNVYALLLVYGGQDVFEAWTDYYPLDKDGCVPNQYAPTVEQLSKNPDNPDSLQIILSLEGQLKYEWEEDGEKKQSIWQVLHTFREDGEYIDRVFRFRQVFTPEKLAPITNHPWDGNLPPMSIDLMRNDILNEHTKAAATVSHLMRKQATGYDMGIIEEGIIIEATDSGGMISQNTTEKTVHLRRAYGNLEAAKFGDATDKFGIGHEVGHATQYAGIGEDWPNTYAIYETYHIRFIDENGNEDWLNNPPWLPDECQCHIDSGSNADWHCMQSLEMPTESQMEGFGNFFAGKLWNDPAEEECYYPYVKWVWGPECLDGASCPDAGDIPDLVENSFEDFNARNKDWKFMEPPVPVPCSNAVSGDKWLTWRESYCTPTGEATADLKNMGNELDWSRFYWGINTKGALDGIPDDGVDTRQRWFMKDIFKLYRNVVQQGPDRKDDEGEDVAVTDYVRWEYLRDEAMDSFREPMWRYFALQGDENGVNDDLD